MSEDVENEAALFIFACRHDVSNGRIGLSNKMRFADPKYIKQDVVDLSFAL
jgi:hypothetical protein